MEFQRALDVIISPSIEGGYVNDPKDPGGETNFGISKRQYPQLDIANLTREQVSSIYYNDYWCAAHCNDLSDNIRLFVFDCAINQGVSTAIKLLQELVCVEPDGVFGPATFAKTTALSKYKTMSYLTLRARKYQSSTHYNTYGNGWLNRLFLIATANAKAHP